MKRSVIWGAVALSALLLLSGCGGRKIPGGGSASGSGSVSGSGSSGVVEPAVVQATASQFSSINLKVKSTLVDASVTPNRSIQLEMYVDGDGNGEGLIGFGDTVLDVRAVADSLYVLVDDTHPVKISDVTARGYFSSVQTSDIGDMRGVGFSFVSDFPTGFDGRQGTLSISTQYAQSSNTYTAARISDEMTMDLVSAINYAIDYLSDKVDETTGDGGSDSSGEQDTGVETFYVNSDYGIEIDGQVYSIGDAINYDDYFQGLLPSGILNSYKYKEDERIDFTHVSYTGVAGQLTVTELSGYVQGLQTDATFKFRGFEKGMTAKEVKWGLGYKTSAKDAEAHPVFDSDIVVDGYKKNTYFCHVGDLNVELRMSKDVLSEIYIEQNLEFA